MDHFATQPQFNTLSLPELLRARDQFHPHLMHKANVVGTAVGRYLIRKDDSFPSKSGRGGEQPRREGPKPPRTLENSEVRDYSWPCVLVFVSKWVDEDEFRSGGRSSPADFVPKTIYLEDGLSVPVCVVLAPPVKSAPPALAPGELKFPASGLSGGYPIMARVQGAERVASIGCLLTDGHKVYALTNRHVAGEPGGQLTTLAGGREVPVGRSSAKQLGRLPFAEVYRPWPGRDVYVNMDVGLVELEDQTVWSPAVHGIGRLGPLADLSVYNLTLGLIGCPVRAHGCASGRMFGRVAALFYRYKSVGGFEYVADFLIGSRDNEPLRTRPGDSGSIWVVETGEAERDLMPLAVQWGGAVFSGGAAPLPFALATNLSNVCRELEVELFRARDLARFEYWGPVGHYSIAAFACEQVASGKLKRLMLENRRRVSFEPDQITPSVNDLSPESFVPLANVPDVVWKTRFGQTPYGRASWENPNHYADLDYAPGGVASLDELTPTAASLRTATWREYYDAVGWTRTSERGLLPFRVWQIYKQMVGYVAARDLPRYVAAAGVLAHYIGDACQPLHGTYLTDGDPFRFPNGNPSAQMLGLGQGYGGGVHFAYESLMPTENVEALRQGLAGTLGPSHQMDLVTGWRNAAFAAVELMRRARSLIPPMDLVQAYADLKNNGQAWRAPTVLWTQFGAQSVQVMADGYRTLAMLWDSAWAEGNGDDIPSAQLVRFSRETISGIYEDPDFVPSRTLDNVDPYL